MDTHDKMAELRKMAELDGMTQDDRLVWEIDFDRRPVVDEQGKPRWEWVFCATDGTEPLSLWCAQPEATAAWVQATLEKLLRDRPAPHAIHVFRPQTLNRLESVCQTLNIPLLARHTPRLKAQLQHLATTYATQPGYTGQPYDPLALEQPPPLPLDDSLLGQQWQFATVPAGELTDLFVGRMIPVVEVPPEFLPLPLGIASTQPIPGIVIEGGRRSLRIAQWLQSVYPAALRYVPGAPDGVILEAGLVDRWIMATFKDTDVAIAAHQFEQRKHASQGLHFLLIQPDDSGMTFSGFWLLKQS